MSILVTGTDGYLGCLLAPTLARRGHEVVRHRHRLLPVRLALRRRRRDRRHRPQGHPPHRRRPRRRRRDRAHGRAVERSRRRALADDHLRDQPSGIGSARAPRRRTAGSNGSSTCRRAASTASRPRATSPRPRRQPADRVRRVQGARRARPARPSPTTPSHRRSCATRPRSVRRRACASTSCSTTLPDWRGRRTGSR